MHAYIAPDEIFQDSSVVYMRLLALPNPTNDLINGSVLSRLSLTVHPLYNDRVFAT